MTEKTLEQLRMALHTSRNGMVLRKTIEELERRVARKQPLWEKAYLVLKRWARKGLLSR